MLSPESLVTATTQATSCEVAGETVILDAQSGQYFSLNPIGTVIWRHIQAPTTVNSVCKRLLSEYNVSQEQCEAEVTALIEQLASKGLIKVSENAFV